MMARKKTIEKVKASELASDTSTNIELLEVSVPPSRKAGIKVSSAKELLQKLKDNEGIKL
jgi:electron transfer flavoprotein beta subunit